MIRTLITAAVIVTSTLLIGATATSAQQPANYYVAVPVAQSGKSSFIARDTVWTWRNTAYTARRNGDRDSVQCELVARQAGKLASFTVGGAPFEPAALEKCNAKAK